LELGRRRTAVFWAEGRQSSLGSIPKSCPRGRRNSDIAASSPAEKIGGDQLIPLFRIPI